MPTKVMPSAPPEQAHSVDRATDVASTDLVKLLFDAIAAHGKQEVAAFYLGVSPTYLSKVKNGTKTLPVHRLSRLPAPILETFFKLGVRTFGTATKAQVRQKLLEVEDLVDALGERTRRLR